MANESRLLNKQVARLDGIVAADTSGPAIIHESGGWSAIGGMRIGDGSALMVKVASVLASVDFPAIQPVGSTGAQVANVVLAGVQVGDLCIASPVESLSSAVVWSAVCFSAGAVQLRALHTNSGNLDLAATDWRVTALRFG